MVTGGGGEARIIRRRVNLPCLSLLNLENGVKLAHDILLQLL
jgi:hypothetical protein